MITDTSLMDGMVILTFLTLIGVIIFLGYIIIQDRAKTQERERDYISAIMAKNLPEYAATRKELSATVKDRIKQIRAENELAVNNAKILENEDGRGMPIT